MPKILNNLRRYFALEEETQKSLLLKHGFHRVTTSQGEQYGKGGEKTITS